MEKLGMFRISEANEAFELQLALLNEITLGQTITDSINQ
jgi:hypothetical protein